MNKKLDYIDALRGIAILGVILFHVQLDFMLNRVFSTIVGLGAKGVQLFYFISSFTLFLSYNNRKYQEKSPVSNFFIRRFFRIAPLYYFAIIYYSFQMYLNEGIKTSLTEFFLNFTFTHGFSPVYINHLVPGGWSIAVEMSFYLMVPLLFSKINNIRKAFLFVFISLLIRFILNQYFNFNPLNSNWHINHDYLYWYLPNQLPCFAIGILFYFISAEIRNPKDNLAISDFKIMISILFVSFLCIADEILIDLNFFSGDFLVCLGFFLLAMALSTYQIPFLVNKFTIFCGKYSYSMYITHFAVLFWIKKIESKFDIYFNNAILGFIVQSLVILAFTIFLSMLTFKLIEEPAQLLGKRIINRKEKKLLILEND